MIFGGEAFIDWYGSPEDTHCYATGEKIEY